MRSLVHPLFERSLRIMVMVHTCTIKRDSTTTLNAYNNRDVPSFQSHLTGVACYLWSPSRNRMDTEEIGSTKHAVYQELRLNVGSDVDVTEGDYVTDIRDKNGELLDAGPLDIILVQRRQSHKLLLIQKRNKSG